MQLHNIVPIHKKRKRKRVGRGATRGTYSGRGIKGQKARAGRKIRPEMRDIIKKIHKKRGYRFASFREKPVVVNIAAFNALPNKTEISPEMLLERGLIHKRGGTLPPVKILGTGKLVKKITVSRCALSKSAKEKIEKAGGTVI